jgi:hypothetical protein
VFTASGAAVPSVGAVIGAKRSPDLVPRISLDHQGFAIHQAIPLRRWRRPRAGAGLALGAPSHRPPGLDPPIHDIAGSPEDMAFLRVHKSRFKAAVSSLMADSR